MSRPKFLHQLQDTAPCTVGIARQLAAAAATKAHLQGRGENAILYEALRQLTDIVKMQQAELDARWSSRLLRMYRTVRTFEVADTLTILKAKLNPPVSELDTDDPTGEDNAQQQS